MKPITVLIADDQPLFREGLRTLISTVPQVRLVGEAANGEEACRHTKLLQPQIILMDLRMPILNGVEATRRICAAHPQCRVIVLTTFDDDEEVFDALRAGAAGYLLKDAPLHKLVEAICVVAGNQSFLQPSIAAKVLSEFNRLSSRHSDVNALISEPLSERECEVVQQLASGKSNKEIAAALNLAEGTIKNHMSNIFTKLNVLDRTQAALRARELGIL